MTALAIIGGAAYIGVAGVAWWTMVSTSKVGLRPTRAEVLATVRRDGLVLALCCALWLPLLAFAFLRSGVEAARWRMEG